MEKAILCAVLTCGFNFGRELLSGFGQMWDWSLGKSWRISELRELPCRLARPSPVIRNACLVRRRGTVQFNLARRHDVRAGLTGGHPPWPWPFRAPPSFSPRAASPALQRILRPPLATGRKSRGPANRVSKSTNHFREILVWMHRLRLGSSVPAIA